MIVSKNIAVLLKAINNIKLINYIKKFIRKTSKLHLTLIVIIGISTYAFNYRANLYCLFGSPIMQLKVICSEFSVFMRENGPSELWSVIHKSDLEILRPINTEQEQEESYVYALGVETLINNMFKNSINTPQHFSALVLVPNIAPSSPLFLSNEEGNFTLDSRKSSINDAIQKRYGLIIDNINKGNYTDYLYVTDFSDTKYLQDANFQSNINKYSGAIIPAIHTKDTLPIRPGYYAIIKTLDTFYIFISPGDFQLYRQHSELNNDRRTLLCFTKEQFKQTNIYKYIQSSLLRRINNLEHKNKIKKFIA